MSLNLILLFSALLFSVGLTIALSRRNAVLILIGTELMLGSANINFLAFWRFSEDPSSLTGVMFALFALAVAAAEAAVGLAIIVLLYRHSHSADPAEARVLRG
jgi:NADH:ubiquinone oxidoreductase subunit K